MELRMLLQLGGLVGGTVYLTSVYDSSLVFTKLWHSAIIIYLAVGIALLLAGCRDTRTLTASTASKDSRSLANRSRTDSLSVSASIPNNGLRLRSVSSPTRSSQHSRHGSATSAIAFIAAQLPQRPASRSLFFLFVIVICLTLRVPVTVAWIATIECSQYSLGCYTPLLLAVYDLADAPKANSPSGQFNDHLSSDARFKAKRLYGSRFSYVAIMVAFAFSSSLIMITSSAPASTYICLPDSHGPRFALLYQVSGLVLDSLALAAVKGLFTSDMRPTKATRSLGLASVISGCLLAVIGGVVYMTRPDLRSWIITHHPVFLTHTRDVAVVVTLTAVCATLLVPKLGVQRCVTIACLSVVLSSMWTLASWSSPLFVSPLERFLVPSLALLALSSYLAVESWAPTAIVTLTTSTPSRPRIRSRHLLYAVLAMIVGGRALVAMTRTTTVHSHPIQDLIDSAHLRSGDWSRGDPKALSLDDLVDSYRTSYNHMPPPNFDKWYHFAMDRDSYFIGDFSNIWEDLLPYWSIEPSRLRNMTVEDIVQGDNGIGGIQIRNHKAVVAPGTPGSHAWMLEAVVDMTSSFIQHIPDMDLAFNLNDESRVMLPYTERLAQTDRGHRAYKQWLHPLQWPPRNEFSSNLSNHWRPMEDIAVEPFRPPPQYKSIFETYGTAHCHSSATSRRKAWWQTQRLCVPCLTPWYTHTDGPYPSVVTNGLDPCNELDLGSLHGGYSAPSTFRPVNELRPTFSQSRAPGFLDIRYPNPWNYAELVKYDPDDAHPDTNFTAKQNTLFWRGTTTEGFASADGRHAWQGMTRQRFVNAANFPAAQTIMIPQTRGGEAVSWRYSDLSAREMYAMLETDVAIDAPIARCMHTDCSDQIALFNRSSPYLDASETPRVAISTSGVNFQDHWQYRYLFDMDGAGFSGRFIPFLHSNSVVVKTTSLFSEWWDGRLQPWYHYIPVDPRLAGLHNTLTYFMGVRPGSLSHNVKWDGRQDQAETIAKNGRDWARKVLRKEDMEIYMFMLLLEWGRLIDEDRDAIGFVMPPTTDK